MTKLLGLLALAHLVLIAVLYMKLSALEERIDGAAASSLGGGTGVPSLAQDGTDEPAIDSRGLDSRELRRIVREELRAARLDWAAAERQASEPIGQPVYDEARMQDRQDRIRSNMEYLKGQAGLVEGETFTCFTSNKALIDGIQSIADNSFVTFSWVEDEDGARTCTRIGSSPQSFYLPKVKSNR